MIHLAVCSPEAIAFIRARSSRLQEIGAGDGRWARALGTVLALDLEPTGSGVTKGDHLDALPGVDVLIVWPPDWTDVYEWVKRPAPTWVFTVGQSRFHTKALAEHYQIDAEMWVEGRKGDSRLIAWLAK